MSRGEEPGEVNVRPVFVCCEISPLFGSLFVFFCSKIETSVFFGGALLLYNKEVIDTSRMEDYGEYMEEEEEEEIMEVVGKVFQRWESTGCDGGQKCGFRLSFLTMWAVLRAS